VLTKKPPRVIDLGTWPFIKPAAQQAPCYSEGNQPAKAHKAGATPARNAGEDKVGADHRVPAKPAVSAARTKKRHSPARTKSAAKK